jgi:phage minor structural protein
MNSVIYVLNKAEKTINSLEAGKSRPFSNDKHTQDLKEGVEKYQFDADEDIPINSTIVLKTPTNDLIPFIVQKVKKASSSTKKFTYYCDAEFLELRYIKIIEPEELTGQTPLSALSFGLQGTRWEVGEVDEADVQTVKIDEYMTALKYLRTIASTFDLELRFRVEFVNNRIPRRYVDFKKRIGLDAGKEIVFGKDLENIERIEDKNAVVTALYGIGPADSTGKYMGIESVNSGKKYVEDLDALQRWSKDGNHHFDTYTPSVADEEMTPQKLFILTKKELNRRIAAAVQYQVNAVDLYDVIGKQHEAVFLGDTVRIKDEGFNPALYLEARVLRIERSYTDPSSNKFILGEYREINPQTYDYIRDIQKVLNGNKNKWNSVDDLKNDLDEQVIKISDISYDVDELRVTYGEIKDTTDSQSSKITQFEIDMNGIEGTVTDMQITIDGNQTTLEEHSSAIEQHARDISLSVTEENLKSAVDQLEKKKVPSPSPPTDTEVIWIDTSVTPNVPKYHNGTSWVKLTPTEASEIGAETPSGAQGKADGAYNDSVAFTEGQIKIVSDEIALSVKQEDFNGEIIASKLNIDAYSIELDTAMINLLGITNVANTLNIGESYNDTISKEINFRGPYGGAKLRSPDADQMVVYGRDVLQLFGKSQVEIRHADSYSYPLDLDIYADTTFHGDVYGLETYYTGSRNGQDLSFAVTSTGYLQIYIGGAYRGAIDIPNFS